MAIERIAASYMTRGWSVFPVAGKIPATKNGVLDASQEHGDIPGWWTGSRHGVGLATGEPSGVWAVDIDSDEAMRSFIALQNGEQSKTVVSKTKRGYHLLFRMPVGRDVRNSAGKIADGIDVRGTGGYIVLPPSPHPDGGSYEWAPGRSPDEISVAPTPRWLLAALTPERTNGTHAEPLPDSIGEGGRNATLASLAGSLRRRDASYATILAALRSENEVRCSPPLDDDEVERIAKSVARYPAPEQQPIPERQPVPEGVLELVDGTALARIRAEKLEPISVVRTPWPMWNRVCLGAGGGEGIAHGWHVIVGAPSGAGKSLFATNLAAGAIRGGESVCLISLEMSQSEITTRLLSIYSGEMVSELEHGKRFKKATWDRASDKLQEAQGSIRINRQPVSGLEQIKAAFEQNVDQGCRTFIVDYLQLAWVRDAETMRHQITEVSHTIRGLAQQHRVLSVGLSQVNRSQSTSGGDMKKEGLMGGSSLENDADQVVLLGKASPHGTGYKIPVILDKNRHGPRIEWDMELETTTLRMTEFARKTKDRYGS